MNILLYFSGTKVFKSRNLFSSAFEPHANNTNNVAEKQIK